MKTLSLLASLFLFLQTASWAQYRGNEPVIPSSTDGMVSKLSSPSLLGFLNPENFSMAHSVSMSYQSFGGAGLGLTMYTNSMQYKIADPLTVKADISFMYSPLNSLPVGHKNDLNGIFLQRAQIDYAPSKDFHVSLMYRDYPGGYLPNSRYGSSFFGGAGSDWWEPYP